MKNRLFFIVLLLIWFQNSLGVYFLVTEGKEKCIYDEIPEEEVFIILIFSNK